MVLSNIRIILFHYNKCPIQMTIRIFKPILEDTFFKQFIEIQNRLIGYNYSNDYNLSG